MALGGEARKILVEFLGDSRELVAASREGEVAVSGFSRKAQTAGKIAGKALAGGLILAGAGMYEATKAAGEDQAAQAQLEGQLRNNTHATSEQIDAVNEWIEAQAVAKGVAVDELRPAMAKLATVTGSVTKSQRLLQTAMDISAGSGKDLSSVTAALVKAQNGSVGGLSRLGLATKDASGHTMTFNHILQDSAKKYQGAAAKAAETTAGKQRVLGVEMHELSVKIGTGLLPAMSALVGFLMKVVEWISKNTKTTGLLIAAIGGLLTVTWAIGTAMGIYAVVTGEATAATVLQKAALGLSLIVSKAWAVATKAAAAAQWLFNAAMDANPIGLVVIAIAALAVGLVLAYKKSETFRNIVNAAFHGVAKVVGFVVDFVKDHWRLMISLMLGPFGIAIALISKHWTTIKAGAALVVGWVRDHWPALKEAIVGPFNTAKTIIGNVWSDIKSGFGVVRDKLTSAVGAIKSAFVSGFDAVKAPVQSVINLVDSLYNKLKSLIDKLTHIPHPHIPGLGRTSAGSAVGGGELGAGILDGTKGALVDSMGILDKIGAKGKKHLEALKAQLAALKDAFASLRDSVVSAFAGDLFSVTASEAITDSEGNITTAAQSAGQNFITSLTAKKGQLGQLSAAFKTLTGWGWKPQALAALFQSGNAALILDLANDKAMATQGLGLYNDVNAQSASLGAQVGNSVYGDSINALNGQIASAGKGGGDNRTYAITVNVPVNGDPVSTGREIVKTIRQLERSTGRQLLVTGG